MTDFYKLIDEINEAKRKAEILDKLGEVTTETIASDKAGYHFVVYSVNGIEVRREYIPDPDYIQPEGDYLHPIAYEQGAAVEAGKWYYTDDPELPREAIASGIPASFDDAEFFDIIAA